MLRRVWANRWTRAGAAAVAVAMWPACAMNPDEPMLDAGSEAAGDVEYANLDFTLKDMHGNDVYLGDFKGRPIVVNFWATWCAPCRHEIPAFVELVEKYGEQGFTVLGVSTDDAPEDLLPFAEEFKMNYPVLVGLGREDLMDAYQAGFFVPMSWFIRADGSVALKWPGTQTKEWFEEQVAALMETPSAPSTTTEGTR